MAHFRKLLLTLVFLGLDGVELELIESCMGNGGEVGI